LIDSPESQQKQQREPKIICRHVVTHDDSNKTHIIFHQSTMSLTPAEQKVRKLARLPANSQCPNCGTIKKFGFSTVCIKFHTFVCNNCKSSHQAISHRCKSLTMSSWSDEEAAELQRMGNDYCRRTWLKNAPPVGTGGRPKEGDPVDVFKRFVVDVYERKRYYGEDDTGAPPVAISAAPHVATAIPFARPPMAAAAAPGALAPPPRQTFRAPVAAPAPAVAATPIAPPVADLLDFGSAAPSPAAALSTYSFAADFAAFAPTAEAPQAAPAAAAPPANDPFRPSFEASVPAPASNSGFAFLQTPPAPVPAPVVVKKPVMSSNTGSEKSGLISAMNMQPQQGFGGGMPNGMNNLQQQQQQRQQMMMMQQQQQHMMMMQRNMGIANGMNMNSMNMGFGTGAGMMNNNNMMMMGSSPMMNQQGMMNGGGFGMPNNNSQKAATANSMNSLDMNISSMSDWTNKK
jgi:hypothetical protein